MKKYILFVFILFFICISFLGFNAKFANAYDSGCIGGGLYSITTGQLCSSPQVNYYNNNNYGCTSAGPYNIVTGQLCYGSQYIYPNTYYYISPIISSITPTSGSVGTQITIYGSGFSTNGCTTGGYCNNSYSPDIVNFGPSIILNAYSYNGTSLTFTIPSYINTNSVCLYSSYSTSYPTSSCTIPSYQIKSGTYPVFVTNANGISNTINFVVTYPVR